MATKHGHATGRRSPTYKVWVSMRERCRSPRSNRWHLYGGRGILVCERWQKFENFLADMGERPPNREIDRIDNNGNYEPGNCRWATSDENRANRRASRRVTYAGETLTLKEWADRTGLDYDALRRRLNAGWTAERAFTVPSGASRSTTKC